MPVQIEKLYSLSVGRQKANAAVTVDMTSWAEEFPGAVFRVLFKPPDSVCPNSTLASSYENRILSWSPVAGNTLGVGYTDICAVLDGHVIKSRIIPTAIVNTADEAAPEDWITIAITQMEAAKAAAQAAYRSAAQTVSQAIQEAARALFIDATLSMAAKAGDAKVIGDRLNVLEERIGIVQNAINPEHEDVACTGLTLSPSTLSIVSGTPQTITATPTPANTTDTITWESSDTSVAVVFSGVVTPVSNGSATITATCGEYTASCAVSVFMPTHCTGISLSRATMSFTTDHDREFPQSLRCTVEPSNTTDPVIWSISDSSVISLVGTGAGVRGVAAVANGTATITVTCGNYYATCVVTVDLPIHVTGVTLSPNTIQFSSIGSTQKITAIPTPANTTDTITSWSSSNTSVATVASDGTVTATGNGSAIITVVYGSIIATCPVSVGAQAVFGTAKFGNAVFS